MYVRTMSVGLSQLISSNYREAENLAMRSRKFNVSALIDAAVAAVGNGARSCKIQMFAKYLRQTDLITA